MPNLVVNLCVKHTFFLPYSNGVAMVMTPNGGMTMVPNGAQNMATQHDGSSMFKNKYENLLILNFIAKYQLSKSQLFFHTAQVAPPTGC